MSLKLQHKIALVTGASRGIGASIAQTLAKQGAYVVGTATTSQGVEAIEHAFQSQDLLGMGVVLDVTSSESIENLFDILSNMEKLPHILVNNAGVTDDNLLLRMDDEAWFRVIETNLTSVYRMTKTFLKPMFRARSGRIIHIGSVVAYSGNPGQVNYTAAKSGMIGFSKSLAQEIGSRGITVNIVAPGFIDTDMTQQLPDAVKEEMLKRISLRRFGEANDIALAVAFLASDDASYITGTTIHVNGGLYMD